MCEKFVLDTRLRLRLVKQSTLALAFSVPVALQRLFLHCCVFSSMVCYPVILSNHYHKSAQF